MMDKSTPQHAVEAKPTVDPTRNVLDLVDAAVHRIDDLRAAETRRVDQIANLRAHYTELLSVAEAKRIDAIRAVDVNAVAVASERATAAASVLAQQVVASADALRALVESTKVANASAQAQMVQQFTDRIGTLEKSSYVGQGRQAFSDPAMADLITEMKRMTSAQSQSSGKSEGISTTWAVIIGAAALVAALFGSGFLNRASTPSPLQVITPLTVPK